MVGTSSSTASSKHSESRTDTRYDGLLSCLKRQAEHINHELIFTHPDLRHEILSKLGAALAACDEYELADQYAQRLKDEAHLSDLTYLGAFQAYFKIKAAQAAHTTLRGDNATGLRHRNTLVREVEDANLTIRAKYEEMGKAQPKNLLIPERDLLDPILNTLLAGGDSESGIALSRVLLATSKRSYGPEQHLAVKIAYRHLASRGDVPSFFDDTEFIADDDQVELFLKCAYAHYIKNQKVHQVTAIHLVRDACQQIRANDIWVHPTDTLKDAWVVLEIFGSDPELQEQIWSSLETSDKADLLLNLAYAHYQSGSVELGRKALERAKDYADSIVTTSEAFKQLIRSGLDPSVLFDFIESMSSNQRLSPCASYQIKCEALAFGLEGADPYEALTILEQYRSDLEQHCQSNISAVSLREVAQFLPFLGNYCRILHCIGEKQEALRLLENQYRLVQLLASRCNHAASIRPFCLDLAQSALRCGVFDYVDAAIRLEAESAGRECSVADEPYNEYLERFFIDGEHRASVRDAQQRFITQIISIITDEIAKEKKL